MHAHGTCGPVQGLLTVLLASLQIVAAMHAYVQRPRPSWVREWPAMVVLAVSQIFWARGVEEAVVAGNVQVSTQLTAYSRRLAALNLGVRHRAVLARQRIAQ